MSRGTHSLLQFGAKQRPATRGLEGTGASARSDARRPFGSDRAQSHRRTRRGTRQGPGRLVLQAGKGRMRMRRGCMTAK